MRTLVLLATLTVLGACATPYSPPSTPAPPEWMGAAGLAPIQGAVGRLNQAALTEGGVIASIDVDHVRTARIRDELRYKSPYGGDMVIAAGTPARAEQLTMFVSSTYQPVPVAVGENNNPIEWCARQVNGDTVCIFWEAPDRARYVPTFTDRAPRLVTPFKASGMIGPMPVIVESKVDLGPPLQQQLVVRDWDREGVDVTLQVLENGVVGHGSRQRIEWNAPVTSSTMRVAFRLEPIGPVERPTGVQVRAVQSPPK